MKKTILILGVMLLSYTAFAQQVNERLRNHKMPEKIENLFRYAEAKGLETVETYYTASELAVHWWCMVGFVGGERPDSALIDSIRQTVFELNEVDGTEIYMAENHQDGKDSIEYKVAIGQEMKIRHQYGQSKYGSPFDAVHDGPKRKFSVRLRPLGGSQGWLQLYYNYTDTVLTTPWEPVNKKEYWKVMKKVMKRQGVRGHSFYIYNDSILNNHSKDIASGSLEPDVRIIQQKGYIYDVESEKKMRNILKEIVSETWSYLDRHPNIRYMIEPKTPKTLHSNLGTECVILSTYDEKHNPIDTFIVRGIRRYRSDRLWLVIYEAKGDNSIFKDFDTLKRYVNGKATYYKKRLVHRQEEGETASRRRLSIVKKRAIH